MKWMATVLMFSCLVLMLPTGMAAQDQPEKKDKRKSKQDKEGKSKDNRAEKNRKKVEAVRNKKLKEPGSIRGGNIFRKAWAALPDTKVEKDIPYVKGGDIYQSLDVYLPKRSEGEMRPLIFCIHGGGWAAGDKAQFPYYMSLCTKKGYVGVSINYRLAWQATYPANINDCTAALQFMVDHAEKYGVDVRNIFLVGGSAGGHLVSLLGTKNPIKGVKIRGVISFYGPHNLNESGGVQSQPRAMMGGTEDKKPDLWKDAKAKTHISADDPAFLLYHGAKDPTVALSESENFKKDLEAAKVPVTLKVVQEGQHGLTIKGESWEDRYERFKVIDQEVFAFIKKHTITES